MKPWLLIALLLPALVFAGGDPAPQPVAEKAEPAAALPEPIVQASAPPSQIPEPTLDTIELVPHKAHYEGNFEVGMRLNGEAIRELERLEDGQWRLSVKASTWLARSSESSRFQLHQGQIRPLHYHYERKVLGKKREATLSFNWDDLRVLNDVKPPPWSMAIPAHAHDRLSYQLQLRQDLAAGATELSYAVADGGRLKTYRFEVLGEETVQSPAGTFTALKVQRVRDPDNDRETLIWFAPERDYAIVKLLQVEPDGKRYELLLKSIETNASQ